MCQNPEKWRERVATQPALHIVVKDVLQGMTVINMNECKSSKYKGTKEMQRKSRNLYGKVAGPCHYLLIIILNGNGLYPKI